MQKLLLALLLWASGLAAQTRVDSVRLDKLYYGSLDKVLDEISAEHRLGHADGEGDEITGCSPIHLAA